MGKRLGKTVHDGKDDSVASRGRKTSDKIHGNVGPWTSRDLEGMQQAGWRAVGVLAACTHVTSGDVGSGVSGEPWPPEPTAEELFGPEGTRMAGELVGVSPGKDPAADHGGDVEAVWWTSIGDWLGTLGLEDLCFDVPGEGPNEAGTRQDGLGFFWLGKV